jgi:cytochrome c oxidase cbb3-type subunit 3
VAYSAFFLLSGWSSDAEFQAKLQAHQAQYQSTAAPAAVKPAEPVAASPSKTPEPAAAPAAVAAKVGDVDAKALYAGKCAMCHGADAKGGFGPDLTLPADKYEYGKSREALTVSIVQGRGNGKMPGFAGQLADNEIAALIDYLLALK